MRVRTSLNSWAASVCSAWAFSTFLRSRCRFSTPSFPTVSPTDRRPLSPSSRSSGPGAFDRALRRLFEERNRYAGSGPVSEAEALAAFEEEAPGIGPLIQRYALGSEALPELARLAR